MAWSSRLTAASSRRLRCWSARAHGAPTMAACCRSRPPNRVRSCSRPLLAILLLRFLMLPSLLPFLFRSLRVFRLLASLFRSLPLFLFQWSLPRCPCRCRTLLPLRRLVDSLPLHLQRRGWPPRPPRPTRRRVTSRNGNAASLRHERAPRQPSALIHCRPHHRPHHRRRSQPEWWRRDLPFHTIHAGRCRSPVRRSGPTRFASCPACRRARRARRRFRGSPDGPRSARATLYRPVNAGGRFSANARSPSLRSSVNRVTS